jgi:hypothetical protein
VSKAFFFILFGQGWACALCTGNTKPMWVVPNAYYDVTGLLPKRGTLQHLACASPPKNPLSSVMHTMVTLACRSQGGLPRVCIIVYSLGWPCCVQGVMLRGCVFLKACSLNNVCFFMYQLP